MDRAKITIKRRKIDHDPSTPAAGWDATWWWTVTDDLGVFESGAPSRDEAERQARLVAESHGYLDRIDGP